MGVIETKARTFRSGDGVAVMLPPEWGVGPDLTVSLARDGDSFQVREPSPDPDRAEQHRKLEELMAALDALGPVGEIQDRAEIAIEFPDRPGLY